MPASSNTRAKPAARPDSGPRGPRSTRSSKTRSSTGSSRSPPSRSRPRFANWSTGPPRPFSRKPSRARRSPSSDPASRTSIRAPNGGRTRSSTRTTGGRWISGRTLEHPKAELVRTALEVRAAHPEAFGASATYDRLPVDGPASDHAVAFSRGPAGVPEVVVVTARFTHSLKPESAAGTVVGLPRGARWRDVRSGAVYDSTVDLHTVRADHPVAILVSDH
ncbi:malto-oligosyltrehalose synthase [Gordonia rubripertincta NBRC 101908]|uniref:Malto-oligosyltrehalose synthase n=1 Tax=Gordonia rubripertincta NBRC 101908 TaxID=1077975 RepID=A0ABQ0HUN4_GORRU|nr:malto-oligosyltrehalose synthase [Gordonia rubripertincta NBRC 101908]